MISVRAVRFGASRFTLRLSTLMQRGSKAIQQLSLRQWRRAIISQRGGSPGRVFVWPQEMWLPDIDDLAWALGMKNVGGSWSSLMFPVESRWRLTIDLDGEDVALSAVATCVSDDKIRDVVAFVADRRHISPAFNFQEVVDFYLSGGCSLRPIASKQSAL